MHWIESILHILFPSREKNFNLDHIPQPPQFEHTETIISMFDYHSPQGKALIYYLKRHDDPKLIDALTQKIHHEILEYLSEQQQFGYYLDPIVIAVPLSKRRKKERGFNQSQRLARNLANRLQGRHLPNLIRKTRETKKQALINKRHERFSNVQGCFEIPQNKRHLVEHKDVIIIDDLVTTGATISEIMKILRKNKVRNIMAITIAH